MEHHPIADLFPMLADDELTDMAADIAERGLLQPIVLDCEGRILDGRNRHAACGLAGVEPEFTTYEGDDPDGYALSVNIARRHLTKGQQAMIAAKARLVSRQTIRQVQDSSGVDRTRLGYANVVLKHAPDLADAVIAGAMGIDAAYEIARKNKEAAEGVEAQLARLREQAPELADKVVEGELTLAGAQAELQARAEQERRSALSYRTVIYQPAQSLAHLFGGEDPDVIARRMAAHPHLFEGGQAAELENAAEGLMRVATAWRKHAEEAG